MIATDRRSINGRYPPTVRACEPVLRHPVEVSDASPRPSGWTDPRFLAAAQEWIRARVTPTGPIEQTHVQPWSTVLKVPTAEGTRWFKAPEHPWEATVTAMLARVDPGGVPEVLAIDETHGWMLLADAGRRLRDVLDAAGDLKHWEVALRDYAELQLAVVDEVPRFLDLGVPDHRLPTIPEAVAALLEADEFLMLDLDEGLTSTQRDELRARLPAVAAMCEELESAGIPDSLQHDDLNDGNVYVDGDRCRVVDWGDACVSHPFHTLTVMLRATAFQRRLTPGGPELLRLRDAYLGPFGAYASDAELAHLADLAYRTGTLARALAWQRSVAPRAPADRGEDLEAVPYGLRKFLEMGTIGDWR
jgi:hypothetical protein